jgi:hypothetical protein
LAGFEGFKTSKLSSRAGTYEYLYLLVGNKKTIKLSEFYHRNYSEIKTHLKKHVPDLGHERFNMVDEFKEIFI